MLRTRRNRVLWAVNDLEAGHHDHSPVEIHSANAGCPWLRAMSAGVWPSVALGLRSAPCSRRSLAISTSPRAGGAVHGGVVELLMGVGVGAAFEEESHRGVIAGGCGGVDGRDALRVGGGGIHVGAVLDEERAPRRDGGRRSPARGADSRRPRRRGARSDRRRADCSTRSRSPERAGLGERDRSAALDQQPGDVVLAMVDRREDRRRGLSCACSSAGSASISSVTRAASPFWMASVSSLMQAIVTPILRGLAKRQLRRTQP